VPPGTKGRALDVAITKTKIKVGLKGQPPIIEVGPESHDAIRCDDERSRMAAAVGLQV
jgi:hypothetical protein